MEVKVLCADQVVALIEYGPKKEMPFWEIVRFAQEICPTVTLDAEGDFMAFFFPDGSSVRVEYRRTGE